MSREFTAFRLPCELAEILRQSARDNDTSRTEILLDIVVEGLKRQMMINEPAVDEFFLLPLSREGTFQYYLEFLQATRDQIGLKNPDRSKPKFQFTKPPEGGYWQRMGVKHNGVLSKREQYTVNGIEYK